MAWKQLNASSLLTRVTGPEASRLAAAAVAVGQANVLDEIAAQVAHEWRGALRRHTLLDSRAGYLPDEIEIHVLADFRYRAYTRLPGMSELLDDLRVEEWRRANTVRDTGLGRISYEAPDTDYAETSASSGKPGPAIADPDASSILGW